MKKRKSGKSETRIRLHCTRIETASVFGAEIGEKQNQGTDLKSYDIVGFWKKMNERKKNVRERTSC